MDDIQPKLQSFLHDLAREADTPSQLPRSLRRRVRARRIVAASSVAITIVGLGLGIRVGVDHSPFANKAKTVAGSGSSITRAGNAKPIPFGIRVSSFAAAQPRLPFSAVMPKGLGSRPKIYVSNPSIIARRDTVLAFVFKSRVYGIVVVKEHLPDTPPSKYQQSLRDLAARDGKPGVTGRLQLFDIRGNEQGLVTTPYDGSGSGIIWLERGVEYIIRGPELDRHDVVAIANAL